MIIRFCPKEEGAVFDGWGVVIDNKCPSCGTELADISCMTQAIVIARLRT